MRVLLQSAARFLQIATHRSRSWSTSRCNVSRTRSATLSTISRDGGSPISWSSSCTNINVAASSAICCPLFIFHASCPLLRHINLRCPLLVSQGQRAHDHFSRWLLGSGGQVKSWDQTAVRIRYAYLAGHFLPVLALSLIGAVATPHWLRP